MFHSTAVRISTFNTVNTLFTVFGDRALSADFSFCTSSVVIEASGLSPSAATKCNRRTHSFEATRSL